MRHRERDGVFVTLLGRAPSSRMQDKVWIPQDDHPEINFIGLLIGPRGMTLKQVETEVRGGGVIMD